MSMQDCDYLLWLFKQEKVSVCFVLFLLKLLPGQACRIVKTNVFYVFLPGSINRKIDKNRRQMFLSGIFKIKTMDDNLHD
jgi:hypothetical protein